MALNAPRPAVTRAATSTALWVALLFGATAFPASAQDRFEIQVYDSETAAPLEPGIELHLNQTASEGVTRLTFEPHLGVLPWLELGAYLQTALFPTPQFSYAGFKLRAKARWPTKIADRVGLALNVEVSRVPRALEPAGWGAEVRPIADVRWGRFYASANPILSLALEGPTAGRVELEPAAKISADTGLGFSLGVEYYGGLGPLAHLARAGEQEHQVYAVTDLSAAWLDLNLGVGYGIAGDERWIVKAILGIHPP